MSYTERLQRYGSPAESAETRLYVYWTDPRKLTRGEDVIYRDRAITSSIAELQAVLADMQEYRQALAARYAELETLPYTYRLELTRHICRDNSKSYHARLVKILSDGSTIDELTETYPGKERRAAIACFEALKKQRPGIETVKDIERKSWER